MVIDELEKDYVAFETLSSIMKVNCIYCNKEFSSDRLNGVFCSSLCANKMPELLNKIIEQRIENLRCHWCGDYTGKVGFCSRHCALDMTRPRLPTVAERFELERRA